MCVLDPGIDLDVCAMRSSTPKAVGGKRAVGGRVRSRGYYLCCMEENSVSSHPLSHNSLW